MKKVLMSAMAAVTALALAGCGSSGSSESSGKSDSTLTIALSSPPVSLDPARASTGLFLNYYVPAYSSLLDRNSSGEIVGALADKWGYVGSGNTEFSLTLRKGVKFADGTPITAQDVIASIQYFAKGAGPSANYYKDWQLSAADSSTVTIKTPNANPVIPDLLTPEFLGGEVISPAGLKDPAQLAAQTFGAGPYVFDKARSVSNDHYVYTPNKNYYDQAAIHYKSITIRVMANTNSQLQALKSNQIDLMPGTADVASSVKGSSTLGQKTAPAIWAGLFLLDRDGTIVPALKDVRVRQALNYAVDRAAITKAVYGEYAEPTAQPAVDGFDGYSKASADAYSYDPEKAKQLLADAGYGSGITIPVNYGSFDPDSTKLVQAVQDQLGKVGVKLKLTGAPNFGGWVNNLVSKKYAATVLSPGSGGSEFFLAGSSFMPGGIMNIFGVSDPDMTAAFTALSTSTDADRAAAAHRVNDVAVQKAFTLPIAAVDTIVLYNKKLDGVSFVPGSSVPPLVTQWTSK
jgi:peptide/nickel transport system substrate-binding protein